MMAKQTKKATMPRKPVYEPPRDFDGANWNHNEDPYTQIFYEQNLSQFWRPEDISLQPDLNVWNILSDEVKLAYSRNLLVLTFLDTYQGDIGMPVVSRSLSEREHQRKAVINFMAAMENAVHAKSYSNIFMTYMSNSEIDELFIWGEQNENLQNIMSLIVQTYEVLDRFNYLKKYDSEHENYSEEDFNEAKYKALVASVFLETWLFYSGFYYPLYFYGQGKLMQAGEMINLILRDESIHGLYVGRIAQEVFETFDQQKQEELKGWMFNLLHKLYREQSELVETIYDPVELSHDVKIFVRYNANKALMNLGFDPIYPYEEVNPVVLNGLNTETKTMDNFSMKGNGYQKMKSESLKDSDFYFEKPRITGESKK
jgi:ribonucleoside-diphosphate reductase beta chain